MTSIEKLREKAFGNPAVREEYDEPKTLNQWRLERGLRWSDVAALLTDQGLCQVLEGRLNRLRLGKTPVPAEGASLLMLTDGEVESFRDEL